MQAKRAILHIHLRKCGGISIGTALRERARNPHWREIKIRRYKRLQYFLRSKKANYEFPNWHGNLFAARQHELGRSLYADLTSKGYEVACFCVLRDPLEGYVSWCNYTELSRIRSGQQNVPFMLSATSKIANPFLHFLLTEWLEIPWWRAVFLSSENRLSLVEAQLAAFNHVYDLSQIGEQLETDLLHYGLDVRVQEKNTASGLSKKTKLAPYELRNLTPSQTAWIERRVAFDTYLWERYALKNREALRPTGRDHFFSSFVRRRLMIPVCRMMRRINRMRARFEKNAGEQAAS